MIIFNEQYRQGPSGGGAPLSASQMNALSLSALPPYSEKYFNHHRFEETACNHVLNEGMAAEAYGHKWRCLEHKKGPNQIAFNAP